MKSNSYNIKNILKLWLILFVIFTLFKIINTFDKTILTNVFSIGTFPLEMTSMILFFYVYSKGEKQIAKIGIISIIVFFIMNVLYNFNLFTFVLMDDSTIIDKIFSFVYYGSSGCITLFNYLALFSLIKTNDEKVIKLKQISIICIAIFLIINLIINLVASVRNNFIQNIAYSIDSIASCAEYTVIVLYLINKKDNNSANVINRPIQSTKNFIQQPEKYMNNQGIINQNLNQPNNNSNIEHL